MTENRSAPRKAAFFLAASIMACSAVILPFKDAAAAASVSAPAYKVVKQAMNIKGTPINIGTIFLHDSTYIALRDLSTSLGLAVEFDNKSKTVKVSGEGKVLEIHLSTGAILVNGQPVYGPENLIQNQVTYLPLRFVLEQTGFAVNYDSSSSIIEIQPVEENNLRIQSREITGEGSGKSWSVSYPVIEGYMDSGVQQQINVYLNQQVEEQIAASSKLMDSVVKSNQEIMAQYPNANIRPPSLEGRFTVTYNERGLLSLYVDYYLDLGGAHGSTDRKPYTFDLSTGEVLSLKEAAHHKENYVSIINSEIKQQIQNQDLLLQTPFESIEEDRAYFLNPSGIVIYFMEYEHTPYALGMPEFVIPYQAFES
ncbi:stalk domain-containing protein [Paenibacillus physcomitrellae]|uniref:DUF4163 domain-containing protein n=1 Tax=Paenibacillus physcomitrellae TaxID=1619311 RepID=A0ABQ1GAZ2_9BACL|nr:stalk domain-containing protein [Paenibacillus physcomitrellae]GGA40147.1 hypothetical protein GCM10010917_26780 [Paenibacillus physcomitrellae]